MKKLYFLFIASIAFVNITDAQFSRYIVRLKNKGGSSFTFSNPISYLSQRAIDRRNRYGIALDSADLPVSPAYITQIRNVSNVTVLNISRWQNAVTIQTNNAAAITTINNFPFVETISGIAARTAEVTTNGKNKFEKEDILLFQQPALTERLTADHFNYGTASYNEIHLHNGEFLHNIGLRGQGMHIAMLDNGFNNYTTLKAFDSINANVQVLGTWDFVAREANVANDGSHGMNCLSTIAANIPGQFVGKAPKANFWLYQTEDNASEYPIEEFNWVCGAERADSSGADVISSSLGYYVFDNASLNYTYSNMTGNFTISAKGADMAAKKGILVFNAAGNEGSSPWKFLISPSDGDSVVAVGAVNASGVIWAGSSYGPSSDGQIKPDMASVGQAAVIQTTSNTIGAGTGTSFACPNMAGLGTCLWQGFPEYNNMKIIKALQLAGHKATAPDDRVGYGIPDMKKAFSILLAEYASSSSTVTGCRVNINWNSRDVGAMKYEIERKAPGETAFTKIGELAPQPGELLSNRSYQLNNDLVSGSSGNYSYRIRQVLDTATASLYAAYIDTTNISISSGCIVTGNNNPIQAETKIHVLPNPVAGNAFALVIETPYPVSNMPVLVYDSKGALIIQLKEFKSTGKKSIELPAGKLAKGQYYIRVMNGNKIIGTTEFLKL
jgi:hypothetical protein